MKKILIPILFLVTHLAFAQTIKLEGYSGSPMKFCPTGEVLLEFSARDIWNNKLKGDFVFNIYVDGVVSNDIRIQLQGPVIPGIDPTIPLPTTGILTDSNKEVIFNVLHRVVDGFGNISWADGFGIQEGDIRIRARFKHSFFISSWKEKDFYLISEVVAPGRAVVVGTDALQFCSAGEVQTVTLPDFPTNTNNATYCYWHHDWVWELPLGWKVTSETGSFTGATNTYQEGKTVKIQAPTSGILFGNYTLNVRSEDAWPFPINSQSTIYTGSPGAPSSISYDLMIDFPSSICYDNSSGSATFFAQTALFGPTPTSYEWDTNAGTITSSITSTPAVTVQFNSPGSNRYIRVRAIGQCGTSAWTTQNFSLSFEALGCSGGGLGGGGFGFRAGENQGINIYPNPSVHQFEIDFSQTNQTLYGDESPAENQIKSIMLIDNLQRVVYQQVTTEEAHRVDVKNLPHGIYFLKITDSHGTRTEKILIDRK